MNKNNLKLLLLVLVLQFSFFTSYGQNCQNDKVKNIIVMIGDGMGVAHITALMLGNEYQPINMERATTVGLVKTYSANNRVTDSAAAATAFATGHKTNNSTLGKDTSGKDVESILEKARNKSMKTGLVVTSDITGATPAGYYAHVKHRKQVEDIAEQLVKADIDVWFGGGKKAFDEREDGKNLVSDLENKGYKVVYDMDGAMAVKEGKVAGLLSKKGYMPEFNKRGNYLPQATKKSLELISKDANNGFFLMVEGSQIDSGGHGNNIDVIKGETKDFDDAVKVAFDFADEHPGTLVVILSDHETGGLSIPSNESDFTASEKGINYHFGSKSHTASMTPLFAYGASAYRFSRILENTEVFNIMCELLNLN